MIVEFSKKNIFPSKAQMKPVIKAPKIQLTSNHFPVYFQDDNFKSFEWHFSLILKSDLPAFRSDPHFILEQAVVADNREKIDMVLTANRRDMYQKMGPNFYNGASFYIFRKLDQKEFVFTNHPKYVIILKPTSNQITLESLIPCENSRMKILQLLNSQVKSIFKDMNYIELGYNKKYYDRSLTETFMFQETQFSVMKGFGAIFDFYESGIKLQLDYSTRVICDDNLWTRICLEKNRGIPMKKIIEESVIGKSFMTIYGNHKLIIIDDVDFDKTPRSPFPDPKYKDFQDYFFRVYNQKIKDPDQFLLINIIRKRIRKETGELDSVIEKCYFVPELLKGEGIPEKLRSNFTFMKEISSRAIISPQSRFQKTYDVIKRINENESKAVQFKVQEMKNQVMGYRFEAPKIFSDPKKGAIPSDDRLKLTNLAEKKNIDNWVLIHDKQSEQYVQILLSNLERASNNFKFGLQKPFLAMQAHEKSTFNEIVGKMKEKSNLKPEFVFFFTTRRTASLIYKDIKKQFNSVGILTQFFVSFNPSKDSQYSPKYNNIVLQMQAKAGSNLWFVENNLQNTLVLGADVYHSRNNRSVASVVGQFGKNLRHSYSTVSIQSSKYQEIISAMSGMFLEILENYLKIEKKFPDRILFYRDGVGQSFIEQVLQEEITSIVAALEKKCTLQRPKITVILVTKRISDKFAVQEHELINPPSGTVVESEVVQPDRATFFMISARVNQGSANPTKYQVVYDEFNSKFEDLIQTTRNLTWGYFNWLGPVKVPAPVQYAHKLCYFIGEIQCAKVNDNLKKSMYYL